MKKEYINNEDTKQETPHVEEPDVAYHTAEESTDTFEEDWENAISGEELVRRVHEHIDRWHAKK